MCLHAEDLCPLIQVSLIRRQRWGRSGGIRVSLPRVFFAFDEDLGGLCERERDEEERWGTDHYE